MRTSALFCAKNFRFFEIYGLSHRQGGLSQGGHFSDKGEEVGQFFAICADVFYGRPLIENKIKILMF